MTHHILRILVICLILSSCQDEKKPKELPLRFEKKSLTKKAGQNCDTDDYDCTIISLEVIKAKGPENISEEINKVLEEEVISLIASEENPGIENLEALAEIFISDYLKASESFSEEPAWEAYVNESIYKKTDNLICIGITAEIFSGGAHGYKSITFLNFDPKTGEELTWKDIFTEDFKGFAEEKFRSEFEIPAGENINSTGFWFENDTFQLPSNIGFSEDKVILAYNIYEIAPYAEGDFYLEIPLDEARQFLKFE
ncbi:DUF3298 and DUF4163 domain-containing protein [Salinimicrobium gaetbulicola]|uniref:DUF3298 domain-containing protein n=1 Tax=Salinimicrobium gaetbulicola TaxID=999702 RepID=A0ABW3IHF9_9FLAO